MNVVGSAAVSSKLLHVTTKQENESKVSLNFYAQSPNYELSLDDFEDYALKRLKVRRTHTKEE